MRTFALLLIQVTGVGCSLKSANEGSRLSLVLPNPHSFSQSNLSGPQGVAPTAWNDPGFACYGVNVTGSGIADTSRNPKPNPDFASLLAGSTSCAYRGVVSQGFTFAAGQTEAVIDLQVPPGAGRVIQLVGITNAAYCASNFLESDLTGSPGAYEIGRTVADLFGDATVTIPVNYIASESRRVDCGGVAATVASVAIVSPPVGSYVNAANQSAFAVSGTCSEHGEPVIVKANGNVLTTLTCNVGSWGGSFDFSNVGTYPDGSSITLSVDHAPSGGTAVSASRLYGKDSTLPGTPSITLSGGGTYSTTQSVSLTVSSAGATEMYFTPVSGCGSGGSWTAFVTPAAYTLPTANSTNVVYAKFRDAAANESTCVSTSITHDGVDPIAAINMAWIESSPRNGLSVNASWTKSTSVDVFDQKIQYYSDANCTTVSGTLIGLTSGQQTHAWTAPSAGTYTYKITTFDYAGRFSYSPCSSPMVIDQTNPANATGLAWNGGAPYWTTSQTITANWTKSVAVDLFDQDLKVFNDGTCTNNINIVPLASATLQTYSYPAGTDGTFSFQIVSRDTAGNAVVSPCSPPVVIDTGIPSVAILNPPAGSYVNAANVASFSIGGSCSENGRTVFVTGTGGVTGSATCTAGAWSVSVNLTGAPEAGINLYANLSDAAGNAAPQDSRGFVKDTTIPTVAITAPAPSTVIPAANLTSFTISGTCSEPGQNVVIGGPASTTVSCVSGVWSANLNLTAPSDGLVALTADHGDIAGNSAPQTGRSFVKDTTNPTVALSYPNGGEVFNVGQSVNIAWSANDTGGLAANPIILEYSTDGGTTFSNSIATGEANDSSYTWNVPAIPSSTTVKVRVKAVDQAGNLGGDVSDTNFTVVGPPTKLVFIPNGTTAPTTINTESCYGPLQIEAQDVNNYPSAVTAATNIVLSTGGPATFYSNPNCQNGTTVSSVNLTVGNTSIPVFYKASSPGGLTFTASVGSGPALTAANLGVTSVAAGIWTSGVGSGSIRSGHTSVWNGGAMIVWGGGASGAASNTGFMTDGISGPSTVTPTNAPSARAYHSAVWTGTEMVVWGGMNSGSPTNTGGRFNGSTWNATAMQTIGAPSARYGHSAIWTGSEMIVWGGSASGTQFNDGGRYDPSVNTWTSLSSSGLVAREKHVAVWTGTQMIIWGGGDNTTAYGDGAVYNTSNTLWAPMNSSGAPSPRWGASAVWTGTHLLVWGGQSHDGSIQFNDGAKFDPVGNQWYPITTTGAPRGRSGAAATWTGTEMVIIGGQSPEGPLYYGGAYNPTTDTWKSIVQNASITAVGPSLLWTGSNILFYGGDTNSDAWVYRLSSF